MRFYPQSSKGFAIDHELADFFGVLDEFLIWEEEDDESPLLEAFEEKFGVLPSGVKYFEYIHDGYIQGLEGFEYDATYVLFDESAEDLYPTEWQNLTRFLEEQDMEMDTATWSELD